MTKKGSKAINSKKAAAKTDCVPTAMSYEERGITMARNRGVSVMDERESGGIVTVTMGAKSDGATRAVVRALMNAGFKSWPGGVFLK